MFSRWFTCAAGISSRYLLQSISRKERNFTVEEQSSVITLSGEGYSPRCIAQKFESLCCSEYKQLTGTVAHRPRCGRSRLTTEGEDRNLIRLSLANRRACPKLLKREYQDAKVQGQQGGFVAAKKPMLTAHHRKSRLQWPKERKKWTEDQWVQGSCDPMNQYFN